MTAELSPEQQHIIELVARGWTDARIAQEVALSQSTVRRRLRAAADALGTTSRAELAATATALGLIQTNRPPRS